MKTFLVAIIFIVILVVLAFFGLKFYQSQLSQKPKSSTTVTLTGVLQPISGNPEYSEVITSQGKTTGVASTHLNLAPYEGKNVEVTGEYSGTTMYADSVKILP